MTLVPLYSLDDIEIWELRRGGGGGGGGGDGGGESERKRCGDDGDDGDGGATSVTVEQWGAEQGTAVGTLRPGGGAPARTLRVRQEGAGSRAIGTHLWPSSLALYARTRQDSPPPLRPIWIFCHGGLHHLRVELLFEVRRDARRRGGEGDRAGDGGARCCGDD